MKSLRVLKAAGLILTAVVLGLMTVQGSYALWNAAAVSSPGTLQAADFSIKVNGQEMAGQTVPLTLGELLPGKTAYTAIDVKNNVNVTRNSPLVLKLNLTGLTPDDTFGNSLVVKTAVPAAGTTCAAVAPTSYTAAPAAISRTLALGTTQSVCIAVELSAATPAIHLGKAIQIPANLTVAQAAPGTK